MTEKEEASMCSFQTHIILFYGHEASLTWKMYMHQIRSASSPVKKQHKLLILFSTINCRLFQKENLVISLIFYKNRKSHNISRFCADPLTTTNVCNITIGHVYLGHLNALGTIRVSKNITF